MQQARGGPHRKFPGLCTMKPESFHWGSRDPGFSSNLGSLAQDQTPDAFSTHIPVFRANFSVIMRFYRKGFNHMLQALPRYCPRCRAPIQADLQHCPACDLSGDALLQDGDQSSFATSSSLHVTSPLSLAPVPHPRRFQTEGEEPLALCLAHHEDIQPPRFPLASPLPLAPDLGNPSHSEGASCAPRFSPAPPLPRESWLDPNCSLPPATHPSDEALPQKADEPLLEVDECTDTTSALSPAPSSTTHPSDEALLQEEDKPLLEVDENADATSALAPAFSPRCFQPEDEGPLVSGPHLHQVAEQNIFLPSLPFASPLPLEPEPGNTHRSRWRAGMVFAILAVLLILTSSTGYIVISRHLSNLNSSQTMFKTTLDSAMRATGTAQAMNFNPYISGGRLIFSDTLKTANSNWDQNPGCMFKDRSYHVSTKTIQSCTLNTNVSLTNFVLEVKVTLLQGNLGGFFFRENKIHNRSNAYLLDFDSKGNYQLWNYSVSSAAKLIDYGSSGNLNTGYNQANVIALVVQKSNITLYANGQMVKRFTDGTYSRGGLSFISSEYAPHTGVSEAAYSNLRLWQL